MYTLYPLQEPVVSKIKDSCSLLPSYSSARYTTRLQLAWKILPLEKLDYPQSSAYQFARLQQVIHPLGNCGSCKDKDLFSFHFSLWAMITHMVASWPQNNATVKKQPVNSILHCLQNTIQWIDDAIQYSTPLLQLVDRQPRTWML